MENEKNKLSRKKFLGWSLGIGALLASPLSSFGRKDKPARKGKMIKMLTPDGKLVEVDEAVLAAAAKGNEAGNKEIFHWMKNPSKKG